MVLMARRALGAMVVAVIAAGCDSAQPPPPRRPLPRPPASRPAVPATDWPGYHGGGAMTGEAAGLPAPPLELLWKYAAGTAIFGGAAIVADAAYFGDADGTLHAVNLADGSRRWTYPAEGAISTTPCVSGGRVYVGDEGGVFHCVRAADGEPVWTRSTDGAEIHSPPNVADGRVLFGCDDGRLYCLDAATGEQRWAFETDTYIYSCPSVADGLVTIAGCDGRLRAIDLQTGRQERSAELDFSAATPLVLADRVIVATMEGNVQCFDRRTLEARWTVHVEGAAFRSPPACSAGMLVLGSLDDRRIYGLALSDGRKTWEYLTRGSVDSSPAIDGGLAYVASGDQKLYALDVLTGMRRWTFLAARGVEAPVAIGRGVLIFGDKGGTVYCLGRR